MAYEVWHGVAWREGTEGNRMACVAWHGERGQSGIGWHGWYGMAWSGVAWHRFKLHII